MAATRSRISSFAAAAAVYEQMLKDNPTDSAVYGALIRAREYAKQLDAALQAARDWHAKVPENPQSVVELIRLLVLTGKKDEAIKKADDYIAARVAEVRKAATTVKPPPDRSPQGTPRVSQPDPSNRGDHGQLFKQEWQENP